VGSAWHAEPEAAEAAGIWGQTFSGQVGPDGILRAKFPSRTREDVGTIGLARRPWSRPYRDGFVLSASAAPAAAILRRPFGGFRLALGVRSSGPWALAWAARGPIGPDRIGADARTDPRMDRDRTELRRTASGWELRRRGPDGGGRTLAEGPRLATPGWKEAFEIERRGSRVAIRIDGNELGRIEAGDAGPGRLELWAEPGSIVAVDRFEVAGGEGMDAPSAGGGGPPGAAPAREMWLSTEALAGAGADPADWRPAGGPAFVTGAGHESARPSALAKWNYRGRRFRLLAPRGPRYGKAAVAVDGAPAIEVDLRAPAEESSGPVLERDLPEGLHSVSLQAVEGAIPCDVLEVIVPGPPPPPARTPFHLLYEPIDDPAARALIDAAIAFGASRLGGPAAPVRTVHLRRSQPLDPAAALRRGFQLTEVVDATRGEYAIYLSARPGEAAFAGQLAHEAFHLFEPRARDVYVEGLNGVLAEEFLRSRGLDWESWLRHFRAGKEPLFAGAYFLMREVADVVGPEALGTLLRVAVPSPADAGRREIDIDRWLDSLDPERRFEALESIRKAEGPDLAFHRPQAR
jgi:hypothetical protein